MRTPTLLLSMNISSHQLRDMPMFIEVILAASILAITAETGACAVWAFPRSWRCELHVVKVRVRSMLNKIFGWRLRGIWTIGHLRLWYRETIQLGIAKSL
jgi:hypothetical protein